jgi:uncharacterized protein (DUF302 family)
VVDHGQDMAAAGQPAYPAWTLIFDDPAAGARLLESDPAAAVDIPLRLAVIARDGGSEIIVRDIRTLIDDDIADAFTDVLRGLATAARERVSQGSDRDGTAQPRRSLEARVRPAAARPRAKG